MPGGGLEVAEWGCRGEVAGSGGGLEVAEWGGVKWLGRGLEVAGWGN